MKEGKVVIFSAPSGSGKTTVVKHLLSVNPQLAFSVSATTRPCRGKEEHGKDYYFLSKEAFEQKVQTGDFIEYEEVYAGTFYGTLRSEVEKKWAEGKVVVFDVDVVGGLHLKKILGERALAIFVKPPSVEVLRQRLQARATDTPADVERRVEKSIQELKFESAFDMVLVNDVLEDALKEAEQMVQTFINPN